ncbi:MAG: hypothetical protein AAF601_17155 [Pseudomonadota bacterium]
MSIIFLRAETQFGPVRIAKNSFFNRGLAMEDALGFLAGALVLNSFAMQSMVKLRYCAIASNFAFIGYGLVAELMPVFTLHALLLPLNVVSLVRLQLARNEELLTRCPLRQSVRDVLLYRYQAAR